MFLPRSKPKESAAGHHWVPLGAEELQTPEELDALAKLSVPSFTRYTLSAQNGRLEFSTMPEMLEVRPIEIGRKQETMDAFCAFPHEIGIADKFLKKRLAIRSIF